MRPAVLLIFSLFSLLAEACPEDRARARVREEADGLNGQIEAFIHLGDGSYEGLIRAYIQHWNGTITRELFLIEVDRGCRVSVWKR